MVIFHWLIRIENHPLFYDLVSGHLITSWKCIIVLKGRSRGFIFSDELCMRMIHELLCADNSSFMSNSALMFVTFFVGSLYFSLCDSALVMLFYMEKTFLSWLWYLYEIL